MKVLKEQDEAELRALVREIDSSDDDENEEEVSEEGDSEEAGS